MHHVAIVSKKGRALDRILAGEKTIESRWYTARRAPWGRIKAGDTIWFKESGAPVSARAGARKVMEIADLDERGMMGIMSRYGIGISPANLQSFIESVTGKRYCILVFLDGARPVRPFLISKKGYGAATAWICVRNISQLRI